MSVAEGKNILLSDALLNELQSVFVHVCDYVRLEVEVSSAYISLNYELYFLFHFLCFIQ